MEKYERGEIAKIILGVALAAGAVTILATMPGLGYVFKYFKPSNARDRQRIKRSMERLEKKGLLKKDGLDGVFRLTQEGERMALRHRLASLKIKEEKRWDKKWRVIMFDVSEDKKQARRAVNFTLKKIGCIQYQKSVFITPFPCEEEINFIGKSFDIRSSIKILIAEKVEGEEALRKIFKI